jgi:hypothetical protein
LATPHKCQTFKKPNTSTQPHKPHPSGSMLQCPSIQLLMAKEQWYVSQIQHNATTYLEMKIRYAINSLGTKHSKTKKIQKLLANLQT